MKTIQNATEKERKDADEWFFIANDKDPTKKRRAAELATKLGLGGHWRGRFLAVKIIYDEL